MGNLKADWEELNRIQTLSEELERLIQDCEAFSVRENLDATYSKVQKQVAWLVNVVSEARSDAGMELRASIEAEHKRAES